MSYTCRVVLLAVAGGVVWYAAAGSAKDDPPKRTPWTTSRVVGTPEPPPKFKAAVAFPSVQFDHPLALVAAPGTGRLFVCEQGGKIFSFEPTADAKKELFADLRADLAKMLPHAGSNGFHELYGLAFHPKFEANRECFVCYTLRGKKGEKTGPFDHEKNLPDGSRVSRFKVTAANPPRLDVASEELLFTFPQGGHNGGDLHFGPDGKLYISTGDATDPNPPDLFRTGQDVTDLLASILRVDVDKRDPGKAYAIPPDNPFVGTVVGGKPARGEVWSYGYRNAWRFSFDRKTGDVWVGDVGWEKWEMVHKAEKGSNHGWAIVEARQDVNPTWPQGPTPVRPPVIEIDHALGASVTGGYVYRGAKFPELVGKYVFGDWSSRRFWAATIDGDRLVSMDEITDPTVRVVAFGEDNAGELFFLDYDAGTVHTLVRNEVAAIDNAKFPRTLSATGLFTDAAKHAVADGVYRYEVVSPMWQDGATAERFVALPGTSAVTDNESRKPIPGNVDWHQFKFHFPKNTVLARTVTLPGSKTRVETQLLHFDGEIWRGYTYAWRDDQADADLVPADGSERTFSVPDPHMSTGKRELNWTFHSRQQCVQCHHFWAEFALGFNTPQLNRDADGANQLVRLTELGLLARRANDGKPQPAYSAATAAKQQKLVDPHDATAPLADRAKAYFHANCGHCHRFGGGGAVEFELHGFCDLKSDKLMDAKPTRGTFDLTDPRVVAPGDPTRSVVYYRMAKFGGGRMPHLGAEHVDPFGVTLIGEWIRSLKSTGEPSGVSRRVGPPENNLATPSQALALSGELCDGKCDPAVRETVLAAAAKLPNGNVRDLFEGYLPGDGKPKKLGTNPRPRAILGLAGDVERGKALFFAQRSQCATCHKVEKEGVEVGPDLSLIARMRSRENLLESVLEPSRRIDPAFQSYQLRTLSGASHTGILMKKTAEAVTLKDAQNKLIVVPADDVESLTPARQSLMPDGLLRDFTAQEAADLLAYLVSRK